MRRLVAGALAVLLASALVVGCRHAVTHRPAPKAARARALPTSTSTSTTTTTVPSTTTSTLPAAPIPQASPVPPGPGQYTVRPGDTLDGIAAAHGLNGPGLCAANHLADCDRIFPGEVLTLTEAPVPARAIARKAPPPRPASRPVARPTTPTARPVSGITPAAYCAAAAAYLAGHAAPNMAVVCAPGASEEACAGFDAGAVGCTRVVGYPDGTWSGTISLDSTLAAYCDRSTMAQLLVASENEAHNSLYLTGRGPGPADPYGPVPCHR